MEQSGSISGFSKLSRIEKTAWLKETFNLDEQDLNTLNSHLHSDEGLQTLYEEFSENTISNFYLPYGLAPNFLINDKWHVIPMAIEESSIVAAASHAAKFWSAHGGFKAEVISSIKNGQVHFSWNGQKEALYSVFKEQKEIIIGKLEPLTASMKNRGGGILDLVLKDLSDLLPDYYQLYVEFHTADAMGANFINSVLEELARIWLSAVENAISENNIAGDIEIDMSILSNYTPGSLVRVWVECEVSALEGFSTDLTAIQFAQKFVRATQIASADSYRAVTHNKGIFNGMDGVIVSTGNDFRAVEACGHAYAARDGSYRSLSKATLEDNIFRFELEIPMSVGTVGGLTKSHPMARTSLKILKNPSAEELMMIIASAGLANNFSAVRSLISGGIQRGHMKMHLTNMLRQLGANDQQKKLAGEFFKNKTITFAEVKHFVNATKT